MKFLLISIGTRGDMEPFLAAAEKLQAAGHEPICQFPEQYKDLALDSGFAFESLGPEFLELLESDAGKMVMGAKASKWKKFLAFVKLASKQSSIAKLLVKRQHEAVERIQPDRIIHHAKASFPPIWEMQNPGKTILLSPVPYLHYIEGKSHLFFNRNMGKFLNKLSYALADFGLRKTILSGAKQLGIKHIAAGKLKSSMQQKKTLYTISPQLFHGDPNWPKNIQVVGYHERDKARNWSASKELLAFLERHEKLLLISFGSMLNTNPKEKTEIILSCLEELQIPAIINIAGGGLEKSEKHNDLFHFVDGIPYDWAFPRVYGVVHHGGSGTTHMAIKNGCSSLIIPHIIDQFVWNQICVDKGLGPKGMAVSKMRKRNLKPLLKDLWENESYKNRAKEMQRSMAEEGLDALYLGLLVG